VARCRHNSVVISEETTTWLSFLVVAPVVVNGMSDWNEGAHPTGRFQAECDRCGALREFTLRGLKGQPRWVREAYQAVQERHGFGLSEDLAAAPERRAAVPGEE
jgi:hypothetical protein